MCVTCVWKDNEQRPKRKIHRRKKTRMWEEEKLTKKVTSSELLKERKKKGKRENKSFGREKEEKGKPIKNSKMRRYNDGE